MRILPLLTLATLAASPALAANPAYTLVDLGPVLSTGDAGKDINASGTVAFTRSTAIYLYQNATATSTGLYANNGPLAINNANHLAYANSLRAYLYRNGAPINLGSLENDSTFAMGLNNSDVVVGYSYRSSQLRYRAFVWQNGSMTELPAPGGAYAPGGESRAYAVNDSGAIAGSYNNQNPGGQAVVWTNGLANPLATLPGYSRSEAYDINATGQTVGYSADANYFTQQAVLWNGTTPTSLGSLPGRAYTYAKGLNDLGMVVGTAKTYNGDSGGNAFLWSSGQMRDLNDLIDPAANWHLTSAYAINNSGAIVGYGYHNGVQESFLAVPTSPVPLPAAAYPALALLAGLGALTLRRKPPAPSSPRA